MSQIFDQMTNTEIEVAKRSSCNAVLLHKNPTIPGSFCRKDQIENIKSKRSERNTKVKIAGIWMTYGNLHREGMNILASKEMTVTLFFIFPFLDRMTNGYWPDYKSPLLIHIEVIIAIHPVFPKQSLVFRLRIIERPYDCFGHSIANLPFY